MTEKVDFGEFSPLKDMDAKTNFDQLDELYDPTKAVFQFLTWRFKSG